MVIDFSEVNLKQQPVLVLRNADGRAIQTLGYAMNLSAKLFYNEVSTINFDIPAYVDGIPTPHYDDIVGMRIIEMVGWGQFILVNPAVEKTGIKEIKHCKAYSLEYELTYKKISFEEGTYNFWNPVARDNTILGAILSYLPSWSVGTVDPALVGRFRTFSENSINIYNFIKSRLQRTYSCIFDFDTYNRRINVRSTASHVQVAPVYISPDNLAKEIEVEEDTGNIFTRLDVNGADDVDIRSVNPMGNNKIYNLDYFMSTGHFTNDIVTRWAAWKQSFAANQLPYFNTTVELALKVAAIGTERAFLTELTGNYLASLKNQQAVIIQYLATLIDTTTADYQNHQQQLNQINRQIVVMEARISSQNSLISSLESQRNSIVARLTAIQNTVSFSNFFTSAELIILDRHFKEDSITDSSFVVSNVESFTTPGEINTISNLTFSFTGGAVRQILGLTDRSMFTVNGGRIVCLQNANLINAEVVSASFERITATNQSVLTVFLGRGSVNGESFPSGNLSFTGTVNAVSSNVAPGAVLEGTALAVGFSAANMFFTRNATEYERRAVEWELFDYGQEILGKLAYPSFSFDVSVANFFALDDFISFARRLQLGWKLYLELGDGKTLRPIVIGVEVDFENLDSMRLNFGDRFNLSDSTFSLVDLLDQSISMGRNVDMNRFSYNSFIDSGASTAVREFMTSALDVSKNAILSAENMAISWDSSGMRFRRLMQNGNYEPEQIGIINNSIVFTDDNWSTAKMAIGKFRDKNAGDTWGVVAPNIVGTLLAGENLIIESARQDGTISVFRVDGSGAALHNATFDLFAATQNNGRISLAPTIGIVGGFPANSLFNFSGGNISGVRARNNISSYTRINQIPSPTSINDARLPHANFWLDMFGDLFIRGNIYANDGIFNGTVYARDGRFSGVVQASDFLNPAGQSMLSRNAGGGYRFDADFLDLRGISITDQLGRNSFSVNRSGFVTIGNGANQITYNNVTGVLSVGGSITMGAGSTINWSQVTPPSAAQVGARPDTWMPDAQDVGARPNDWMPSWANIDAIHGRITGTFIAHDTIMSPHIAANQISAREIAAWSITADEIAANAINAWHIQTNSITADRMNVTQLSAISANLGTITAGTINGITINGSTINFGGSVLAPRGSLFWDMSGNDGSGPRPLINMRSFDGIRIDAQGGGINLASNTGIWLGPGNVHIMLNGQIQSLQALLDGGQLPGITATDTRIDIGRTTAWDAQGVYLNANYLQARSLNNLDIQAGFGGGSGTITMSGGGWDGSSSITVASTIALTRGSASINLGDVSISINASNGMVLISGTQVRLTASGGVFANGVRIGG